MKIKNLLSEKLILLSGLSLFFGGCTLFGLDLQEDYDYKHQTLDPHINITARQFLENRSKEISSETGGADTVFKWWRKGLEYAGIDLSEFEKTRPNFYIPAQ